MMTLPVGSRWTSSGGRSCFEAAVAPWSTWSKRPCTEPTVVETNGEDVVWTMG